MVPDSFYDLRVHERFAMLMLIDSRSSDEQRAAAVARIKAMPYQEFLETEYWMVVRNYVVKGAESKCKVCGEGGSLEVHHRSYKHHGQEHLYLADLEALCRACHEIKHKDFDNIPADPEVAKGTMAQAIRDAAGFLSQPFIKDARANAWYRESVERDKFSMMVFGERNTTTIKFDEDDMAECAAEQRNHKMADVLAKRMTARLMGAPAPAAVPSGFTPITQADIDAAVQKNKQIAPLVKSAKAGGGV